MFKKNSNFIAILGPTNTGKTYLAFDRMTSYNSGIFGFPLRLLARENYDKAVKKLGIDKVALITGEEKIYPEKAKYFFCTVESMPSNIEVECVAIDEVQLAADYERGHIFTDKILNFRGLYETMFLGSSTIEKLLIKLFPNIKIEKRDRYSKLSFSKVQNISKLKPKSAVIAFNVNKIYEIAEMLKFQKGGAAVVLGSLSPRTRNAQVEIYENNNVDYLVATDAIGMGLNLNINHICFSSFKKFDGRYVRNLRSSEIGQIAGRAGRYQNNGTFSYTKEADKLDPITIKSIEEHNFDEIRKIYWRNSKIDFSNINSLLNSLGEFPIQNYYIHKKNAEDEICFRTLIKDEEVKKFLSSNINIKLLWDVCRVPDFQKIMNDSYLALLKKIFLNLIKNNYSLNDNWINENVTKLEDYSGGIDELSRKIANIRTWTYLSHQPSWLKNADYWQSKTRSIEDNLSDQLHESLTNRFIDTSASYFVESKNKGLTPKIQIKDDKSINLDGQTYGYISGFNLELSNKTKSISLYSNNHVKKTIRSMLEERIKIFLEAPADSINLGNINELKINNIVQLFWGDEPIGFLKKGENIFSPIAEAISSQFLETEQKNNVTNKLQKWIDDNISNILYPIKENLDKKTLAPEIRSIAFNLFNNLGTMPIDDHKLSLKDISIEKKNMISKLGIRIGAKFFYMPNFLKKNALELKALLWRIFYEAELNIFYPLPTDGRVSFISSNKMPDTYWLSIGYICIDDFVVRVDSFEKIFFLARKKIKFGPFIESSDLMNPLGCNSSQLSQILNLCGFDNLIFNNEKRLFFIKFEKKIINKKKTRKIKKININLKKKENINLKKKENINLKKKENINLKKKEKIPLKIPSKKIKKITPDPNSPFAVLQKLL